MKNCWVRLSSHSQHSYCNASFFPNTQTCFRPSRHPASPQLHEHLSLHHTTRRLGRRPYGIPGSPNCSSSVEAPTIPLDRGDSGGGASSHAGGNTTGDWELTSPPDVLTRRQNFGLVENRGSGSAFGGAREDNGGGRSGGLVEEEMRGCAEWAVTFSGSLDQGITTVKVSRGGVGRRKARPVDIRW